MIKLLPKIDGVINRFDRPFLRKKKFTGIWHDWALSFTLTVVPLFESSVGAEAIFETALSNQPLFAANVSQTAIFDCVVSDIVLLKPDEKIERA